MNLRVTVLALLALLVVLVVVPLMTYDSESTKLTMDTISRQTSYSGNQNTSPSISVIPDRPVEPVQNILPHDAAVLETVDYSRYFVLIVHFGYGSQANSAIQAVYQFKSVCWVKSRIKKDDNRPTEFSPYQIIKVDKSKMACWGKITFRLLNQFEEKAKAVQHIPPVNEFAQTALISLR